MSPIRALVASVAIAIAIAVAVATIGISGSPADAAHAVAPTITRSAHVAFENCDARHVVLSVTVARQPFRLREPVTVKVLLRNTGSATCGTPLAEQVPQARSALTVGPCGALPLVVRSGSGTEVYPGPAVFHCPEETGFRLGAHSTARATGFWIQPPSVGAGSALEPGAYRLTVDGAVTVPVTLTSG